MNGHSCWSVKISEDIVKPYFAVDGLRVVSDNAHTLQQMPSSSSATAQRPYFEHNRSVVPNTNRVYQSALKNADGSPRAKHRVTISAGMHSIFSEPLSSLLSIFIC